MEWERIFGLVFSGLMVRLYATGLAVLVASKAFHFITNAFGAVSQGFGQ